MRAQRTALLRITHGSPSKREARTPTAPAGHLLAAPRWCAACGHGIAADKGNSLVRHARTAHRAAAHYAWLTLKEGGKNSHRRGFAAPPPSVREASCNHSRKQNRILRPRPTFAHTCAYGERVNAARYYVAIAPQRENPRLAIGVSAGFLSNSRRFSASVRGKSVSK